MKFERIEEKGLSHYSYIVACPGAREAAVVDPKRDIDTYLAWAAGNGYKITRVMETHIHADYASGARELAEKTGAELMLSAYDEGEIFDAVYPHTELRDGDAFKLGGLRFEVMHTPGHTPEHISYLVYEESRSKEIPELFLTGDFLFVGSLGRPDLLGEESKIALAHQQWGSVQRMKELPDGLEVHPAHGSGSMCGAGMSGRPSSTLGFEKATNPYFQIEDEEEFVKTLLATVPEFPPYYRRMKALNSAGAPDASPLRELEPLQPDALKSRIEKFDVAVVDIRPRPYFEDGHIPGSYAIGKGQSFVVWASWVLDPETPIVLVGSAETTVEEYADAQRGALRVGLDNIVGRLEGGFEAWRDTGNNVATANAIDVHSMHDRKEELLILDVRTDAEWSGGHIDGATHIMAGWLEEQLEQLPKDQTIAVTCEGGYRSTVATSILQKNGFDDVLNLTGGMQAWRNAGYPVTA